MLLHHPIKDGKHLNKIFYRFLKLAFVCWFGCFSCINLLTAGTVNGNETYYIKNKHAKPFAPDELVYSSLSLKDSFSSTLMDGAMVLYNPTYSNAVDFNDALKISTSSENTSFKRNNILLAVERRKTITENDTLFLNISGMRIHKYQWRVVLNNFANDGRSAVLVDNFLKTTTSLNFGVDNLIVFQVTSNVLSNKNNRFHIIIKYPSLPEMSFSSFSASRDAANNVHCNWQTFHESNVNRYVVQRSFNETDFDDMVNQMPTANNYGSPSYSVMDYKKENKVVWYRVACIPISGTTTYSSVAKLLPKVEEINQPITVFPNPSLTDKINISFGNKSIRYYTVSIYNEFGALRQQENVTAVANNYTHTIIFKSKFVGKKIMVITDKADNKILNRIIIL